MVTNGSSGRFEGISIGGNIITLPSDFGEGGTYNTYTYIHVHCCTYSTCIVNKSTAGADASVDVSKLLAIMIMIMMYV